jgi:type VI secretion system protein ImpA
MQKAAGQPPSSPALAAIESIFKDCDPDALEVNREAVGESLLRLSKFENILNEKVGSDRAPHFEDLRQVLNEIQKAFGQPIIIHAPSALSAPQKKMEPPSSEAASIASPATSASIQRVYSMDTINSRQDITRILDQICLYYEKNEPASPVPLLLKRAARLVDKNFFEIIQDMAPESFTQIQKLIGESKETGS